MYRCEDIILQCNYDGKEMDRDECCEMIFPEPSITSHGPCLTSHGRKQTQRIFGKKGGLTFVLKTDDYSQGKMISPFIVEHFIKHLHEVVHTSAHFFISYNST
jgi:hypothetical protein